MIVRYNTCSCPSMNCINCSSVFLAVSMVMFSTFEHSVDFLYRNVVKRKKEDCSKAQQLGVTCLAGYAAGSVGSFISNPADNIVASLYNRKADSLVLVYVSLHLVNDTSLRDQSPCTQCAPLLLCAGCQKNWASQSIYQEPSY